MTDSYKYWHTLERKDIWSVECTEVCTECSLYTRGKPAYLNREYFYTTWQENVPKMHVCVYLFRLNIRQHTIIINAQKKQSGMKTMTPHGWLTQSYSQIWWTDVVMTQNSVVSEWNGIFTLRFCGAKYFLFSMFRSSDYSILTNSYELGAILDFYWRLHSGW